MTEIADEICDFCGSHLPTANCEECSKTFCLKCDDLCHKHPDRIKHARNAIGINSIFVEPETQESTCQESQNNIIDKTAQDDTGLNTDGKLEFTARPGTIDYGRKFEVNMTALYAIKLCLNDNIKDVLIASNADGYGAFDDVLIRVEYETGHKELYAIQLKHKLKELTILKDDFSKKKSQFFLEKYKGSYENDIKNKFGNSKDKLTKDLHLSEVTLCLLTNASIKQDVKNFLIDSLQLGCKTIYCSDDDIINTKGGGYHTFEINTLAHSFPQYVVYHLLQENFCKEITEIKETNQKLLERFDSDSLSKIINRFQNQLRQQFIHGEIDINEAINKAMSVFDDVEIINYVADFFQKELNVAAKTYDAVPQNADYEKFVADLLQEKYKEEIQEIQSTNIFENISPDDLKKVIDYFMQTIPMRNRKCGTDNEEKMFDCVSRHFQHKFKSRKQNEYSEFFSRFRVYDAQADYKQAEEEITRILQDSFGEYLPHITKQITEFIDNHFQQTKSVLLTKRDVKMKLLELLTDLDLVKDREDLEEKYEIFKNITSLSNYKQRAAVLGTIGISLQGRGIVSLHDIAEKSFNESLSSTFLLKNIRRHMRLGNKRKTKSAMYLQRKVYKILLNKRVLWETNSSIFLLNAAVDDISHGVIVLNQPPATIKLPYTDKKNIIIIIGEYNVRDYLDKLKNYFSTWNIHYLKVSNNFLEWQESWGDNIGHLNNFIIEQDTVDERDMLEYFNKSLNVICAVPGMGKSEILNTLADYCEPNKLVLRFNLNEHRKIISQKENEFYQNPLEYICKLVQSPTADKFEHELFTHLIARNQVVLLVDAYDEVAHDYSENVLAKLEKTHVTIWVATRPIHKHSLQDKFKVMTINIQPFTKDDSQIYLETETTHAKDEISNFLARTDFYQTPLHLTMLTEVLHNQKRSLLELEIVELYRHFVKIKYDLALKRNEIETFNLGILMTNSEKMYWESHKLIALCVIYGKQDLIKYEIIEEEEFDKIIENFKKCKDLFGLVTAVQDDVPIFSHRTYAEFLAALWLSENINRNNFTEMYDRLFNPENHAVRLMFDRIECKDNRLLLATLDLNQEEIVKLCETDNHFEDKHGRTPLHMAVSYFKQLDSISSDCRLQIEIVGELVRKMSNDEDRLKKKDALRGWDWWQYAIQSKNDNLLHHAAYWGQEDVLKLLIAKIKADNRRDINCTDHFGRTALYLAVLNGQSKCVDLMIKKKANVNLSTTRYKPLLIAAEIGHIGIMKLLVDAKADIHTSDEDGRTALHFAASGGHGNCIQFLLKKGAKINAGTCRLFITPLFVAAWNGHLDAVDILIANKANLAMTTFNCLTALHGAAMNGHTECVKCLLLAGADKNVKNRKNCTPLYLAAERGYVDTLKILIKNSASLDETNSNHTTALHVASCNGNTECVQYLLEQGAKVNVEDVKKRSPLFLAAEFGHSQIVQLLLDNEGNLNIIDVREWTALHAASFNGHIECMIVLIENGGNVNAKDINQCSPIHLASNSGHLVALILLTDNGADVNDQNLEQWVPLHFASAQGHVECVEFLLQIGADVNLKTSQGCTALHLAAQKGNIKVVQVLADNRATINETNATGHTALHMASMNGHRDCVQILLQAGADGNCKTDRQFTSSYLAIEANHKDVLKLLMDDGAVDVNYIDECGRSYLHVAAFSGHLDIVKMLLAKHVNVELIDFKEETPLDVTFRLHHLECVEFLQKFKKRWSYLELDEIVTVHLPQLQALGIDNLNAEEQKMLYTMAKFNYSPLCAAVANNLMTVINHLGDVDAKRIDECNLLQIAAKNGHLNMLKWLLSKGAKIDGTDKYRRTALFLAARMGHKQCVEELILKGANKNIRSVGGYTAFLIAVEFGDTKVIQSLINKNVSTTFTDRRISGLMLASLYGHLEVVKYLLDNNDNVNNEDEDSYTSLIYAAKYGNLECVKYLVDKGADVNKQNSFGNTSLHYAAIVGNLDIITFLVGRNANPTLTNKEGQTPDQVALNFGHRSCVRFLTDSTNSWKAANDEQLLDSMEDKNILDRKKYSIEDNIKSGDLNVVKRYVTNVRGTIKHRPLITAAQNGHLHLIQWLLMKKADINCINSCGETALFMASRNGHLQCVNFLLAKEADMNVRCDKGYTCLLVAAERDQLAVVKSLVEKGVDINVQQNQGSSALMLAASKGHLDVVKYLQKMGANLNIFDQNGFTGVMLALSNHYLDCAKFLIDRQCNLHGRDFNENTLLHVAAFQGDDVDIVKHLIGKGVDPIILNKRGETPADVASKCKHEKCATYLRQFIINKNGLTEDIYKRAVLSGRSNDVKSYVNEWCKIYSDNINMLKPLHLASVKGYSLIVQLLVENGAMIDETDKSGRTALFLASQENHLDCGKILVSKGANINTTDNNGCSPLLVATQYGNFDVVKLLLQYGAFLNQKDRYGRSALMIAARYGHLEIIEHLIQLNVNCDDSNEMGYTAITYASEYNHLNCVRYLAEKGAQLNNQDVDGNTPLHCAAFRGHFDVVEDLVSKGANPSISNNTGKNPSDTAHRYEYENCAQFLKQTITLRNELLNYITNEPHQYPYCCKALMTALLSGHLEIVKDFVDEWRKVTNNNINKLVPLHIAAMKGQLLLIQLLIENEACIDEFDVHRRSALFFAAGNGHIECVKYLVDKEANVNAKTKLSHTPLHAVDQSGNSETVILLLDKKSILTAKDAFNRSALMVAAGCGHFEIVQYLLKLGIDADDVNNQGSNALAIASENGHLNCVRILTSKTNLNKKDVHGDTPLHCAAFHGHVDVIAFLVSKGADVTITNNNGETAAAVATKCQHETCVSYLKAISLCGKIWNCFLHWFL